MENPPCKKHFVLVHGACQGAWCWYKVKPLLEVSDHRVTVLDMAASGINLKKIHDLQTFADYCEPLIEFMKSIPDDHKVILVGHSLGGINIAMVMEMFPYKIELAVFLTAFMPDTHHTPSFVFDQFIANAGERDKNFWLDTEFKSNGDPEETLTTMLFGPHFTTKLYHLSPHVDFELAMALKRPSSMFLHDLSKPEAKLSKERYGSVERVYVICEEDQVISRAFQRWMIENYGLKEVKELKGSDHMPMFSVPQQLCDCLLELAQH